MKCCGRCGTVYIYVTAYLVYCILHRIHYDGLHVNYDADHARAHSGTNRSIIVVQYNTHFLSEFSTVLRGRSYSTEIQSDNAAYIHVPSACASNRSRSKKTKATKAGMGRCFRAARMRFVLARWPWLAGDDCNQSTQFNSAQYTALDKVKVLSTQHMLAFGLRASGGSVSLRVLLRSPQIRCRCNNQTT